MRICYISTFPPTECGIATYTEFLTQAMIKLEKEVLVVSQVGASGNKVFPAYSPLDNDIATKLLHMTSKLTPDLIHIQHEFGLFGTDYGVQVVDFMLRCKLAGIPVVVTMHTVYKELNDWMEIVLNGIVSAASAIIVHENYQKETLKRYFPGSEKKTSVIPHGVRDINKIPNAKAKIGVEGKKVILLAGYFRPTKRFDIMVKAFPKIAEKNKDAVLVVSGKTRGMEHSDYQKYFFDLINNSPHRDRIIVLRGQFPQYTFDTIMSAADVIAMPYEVGAQSGILAQSSAFHIPVVSSDLLSFKLWNEETGGGLTCKNEDEYVKNTLKIIEDEQFANKLQSNIKKYIQNILWSKIAKRHLPVYEDQITVPYGKAKYFYVPEED